MSTKHVKAERKRERKKERVVEAGHKLPCPICNLEGGCCKHCNHRSIWGK